MIPHQSLRRLEQTQAQSRSVLHLQAVMPAVLACSNGMPTILQLLMPITIPITIHGIHAVKPHEQLFSNY